MVVLIENQQLSFAMMAALLSLLATQIVAFPKCLFGIMSPNPDAFYTPNVKNQPSLEYYLPLVIIAIIWHVGWCEYHGVLSYL